MELAFCKRVIAFLLSCSLLFSVACSVEGLHGDSRVKGVNLGGWLVIEGWIKPSLFDGIPNGDMLDGTEVQLKSVTLQKYVSADNGGGMNVTVDRDNPLSWETFRLWRVSESIFHFRTLQGQFLTCNGSGSVVTATAESASDTETFYLERNKDNRVHIKLGSGTYLQASNSNQLTADYSGTPGWDDNAATFEMSVTANNLHGDYQLANGYGYTKAKEVLKAQDINHGMVSVKNYFELKEGELQYSVLPNAENACTYSIKHRNTFITVEDFDFLYRHGINTVRIPVGWWIAFDPNPPPPFIEGSLEALDNAFSWAQAYSIKCIIDLHAAPGSQNGMEHSASRDGTTGWPSPDFISQTLDVIEFLASRYAKHPSLLGIELLNEPLAATVPLDVLVSFYKQGYQIVRNYSSTAYVIFCQRIGNADPFELYQANLGSINTVVDLHYYNMFDTFFSNMSTLENIQFIYKSRESQVQALDSANGPLVYIGEWVNEWNLTNGSQTDYQSFGRAQLEVYNAASFGWTYWTLKNDREHWDFEWNIRNNYLQLQPGCSSSRQMSYIILLLVVATCCLLQHHLL